MLLVEDSPDDAYFFQRQLGKLGGKLGTRFSLTHVSDGKAAVEVIQEAINARSSMPDAIFLDLKMPIMNGFEVLEWVRQQPWADTLNVTVLSGSDQQADVDRAQKLGATGYLVKPVTSSDLEQILQRLPK
ncbi:MAG: response regulator [Limisphaerales bacterium]